MGKYGNIKTIVDGIRFDSKREAEYYQLLKVLKKANDPKEKVERFELQPRFDVIVNGKKICKYYADFKVWYADRRIEVVDCKGMRTQVYRLKKKLVEAIYNIKIKEV